MSGLLEFQRAFSRELLRSTAVADGVRVHRNTVIKALIDALGANYPTIVQLVGSEWFEACALEYVRTNPARTPALVLYGESFPAFLSEFAPARELPYLGEVARIDRLWIESYTARDAKPLEASALASLSASELFERRIRLHPATRFGWFRHSAATIWAHHRSPSAESALEIADQDEGLLLTRAQGPVEVDQAMWAFLEKLRAGGTLGAAATSALEIDAQIDIASRWARLVTAGAFVDSGECS
jgi:hypothetical protein